MYTPLVLPFAPDEKDLTAYKVYGSIIALGIIWGQHHLPLSPFFLLYLLHGFNSITDISLIRAMAPEMGHRLSSWPPPTITVDGQSELQLQVGCDPMNMIFEHFSHIQVCFLYLQFSGDWLLWQPVHLRRLSPDACTMFEHQIIGAYLFGTQDIKDKPEHPLVVAFKSGFESIFTFAPSEVSITSVSVSISFLTLAPFLLTSISSLAMSKLQNLLLLECVLVAEFLRPCKLYP